MTKRKSSQIFVGLPPIRQILDLATEVPAKQAEVLRAAMKLRSLKPPADARILLIANKVYGFDHNQKEYMRIKSVVESLRKKGWWPYTSEGIEDKSYKGPTFVDRKPAEPQKSVWSELENVGGHDFALGLSISKEQMRKDIQDAVNSDIARGVQPCCLHDSPEVADHNFAIKVLEEYGKLSRDSQKDLWLAVKNLVDCAMNKEEVRKHMVGKLLHAADWGEKK